MNRVFQILLLWLLIAALPLQGFAAVVKTSCDLANHHPLPLVSMTDGQHHHDATLHPDADCCCADASATTDQSAMSTSTDCSACAACCVGTVVLPSALIIAPDHAGSEAAVVSPAVFIAGHIPSGLDRPPRDIAAESR